MKTVNTFTQKCAIAILSAGLLFSHIAEAKRVGGGRSSGMQRSAPSSSPSPSYNSPRPSPSQPSYNQPSYGQNNNRNYGSNNNGGYQNQQPQRSGPGWGTVAGAAVAGAVAGAVLADDGPSTNQNNQNNNANNARPIDYGTAGAPAVQNNQNQPVNQANNPPQESGGIGFFGWLILGLLAFFAYRFFKKKMSTPAMSNGGHIFDTNPSMGRMPDQTWPGPSQPAPSYGAGGGFGQSYGQTQNAAANHPDAPALLREARATFQRMQTMNSVDQLQEIRRYLTDSMFTEIQGDISGNDALADFPELNARLIEVATEKGLPLMSVEFSGLCSDAPGEPAMSFCETWHFVKQSSENHWRLAGIQQA